MNRVASHFKEIENLGAEVIAAIKEFERRSAEFDRRDREPDFLGQQVIDLYDWVYEAQKRLHDLILASPQGEICYRGRRYWSGAHLPGLHDAYVMVTELPTQT